MSVTPSRSLYLYLKTVEIALQDAIVTDDEATILHVLANALGISPGDTAECVSIARGEEKNPFDNLAEDYSGHHLGCLLYTSPSPRDRVRSRMPSSA